MLAAAAVMMLAACNGAKETLVSAQFGENAPELVKVIVGNKVDTTVVVKDGMVLAVEAFEGTNAAIRRGAKLGGRGAVVVKIARDGHDMRFDIPVVGAKTLRVLRRSRFAHRGKFQAFSQTGRGQQEHNRRQQYRQ